MSVEMIAAEAESISLEDLVTEAELLTRFDRKYLIRTDTALQILADVVTDSRVLEIEGQRSFNYDSVYFDTADHLAYRLTAQRRRRRFKLRTRSYLDTGACFLEVKTKDGRGNTVKERISYSSADRTRLTAEGKNFAAEILHLHADAVEILDQLAPSMVSQYRRTTLLLPSGSRATVDTDLIWQGAQQREVSLPDHVIVESKAVDRASELDRALWAAGQRPSGFSKFGIGTAALNPELPRNKWTRVFAGPLSTTHHTAETSH